MTTVPFNQESAPASSIGELIAYLQDEHSTEFVYRGQTQAWPNPLFPSIFRYYVPTGKVFNRSALLPFDSMRASGQVFHEVEPVNHLWEFADLFCQSPLLSQPELNMIDKLADDPWFSLEIQAKGSGCFTTSVPPEYDHKFSSNYGQWKLIIDQLHRDRIRQLICLNPFGYVLGMAIAQHYGFSSETLDVTHDPTVAGFFATHEPPHYNATKSRGVGVVYRFQLTEKEMAQDAWSEKDLYNASSFVDMTAILSRFLERSSEYFESFQNLVDHIEISLEDGLVGRKAHRIQIGENVFSPTRVARQKAALIVPDLLFKEQVLLKMKIKEFMAVEDIGSRPETTSFYFLHSSDEWRIPNITREYLWPEHDVFVDMFDMVLSTTFPMVFHPSGMALPKRRDLLDRGYLR